MDFGRSGDTRAGLDSKMGAIVLHLRRKKDKLDALKKEKNKAIRKFDKKIEKIEEEIEQLEENLNESNKQMSEIH